LASAKHTSSFPLERIEIAFFIQKANVRLMTIRPGVLHVGVQGLLLGISTIVPFSFPLIFGFDEYGKFVLTAAGAFLVQRYCDAAGEPLVVQVKGKSLLRALVVNHLTIAAIGSAIVLLLTKQSIHWQLLAALLCSSIVFAFVSQTGDPRRVLIYLSGFAATYIVCIGASFAFKISLVNILITSNGLGAIWGMMIGRRYLITNYPSNPTYSFDLISFANGTVIRIGACAFAATLSFGLPIFVAAFVTSSEIGIIRVFFSVIFLAPFLLPVNQKSLLPILKEAMNGDGERRKTILSYLRWQAAITLCVVCICIVGGMAVPLLQLHFLAVGLIPIFMSIVMAERAVIVSGRLSKLAWIGLAGAIIIWLIQESMAPMGLNSILMGATMAIAIYAFLLSLALAEVARYWMRANAFLAMALLAPAGVRHLVFLLVPACWLLVLGLSNKSTMKVI
jgi:hypothetical protein